MNDVKDPGAAIVDVILNELEEMILPPTDVARQARRLRAHIMALRAVLPDDFSGCGRGVLDDEVR